MTYYILDAQGNLVTTDTDKVIATLIAEELGGEVVTIQQDKKIKMGVDKPQPL